MKRKTEHKKEKQKQCSEKERSAESAIASNHTLSSEVDREAPRKIRRFFLLHLKPSRLPAATLRFTHTFGLGGSALVLFALLAVTGMMLMLVYEASPERAYTSIMRLRSDYRFGAFVRNIHYWSANLLIAVVVLHMLRVFYTGGFHEKRKLNWIFGVLLLFSVLGAGFTGYLLPWDQLSYWAITVSTGMLGYVPFVGEWLQVLSRGGDDIGARTLVVFYAFHTSFIPITLMVLMGFHFFRVRKARGVVVPHPLGAALEVNPEPVAAYPNLVLRELSLGLLVTAGVLALAVFFDAPLGDSANPGLSPNPAKSPWYFLGFQELQLHFHPVIAAVAAPLIIVASLAAIPYIDYGKPLSGPWFLTPKGRRVTLGITAAVIVVVSALVFADDMYLRPSAGTPSLWTRGIAPIAVLSAVAWGIRRLLVVSLAATTSEVIQALFTLFFVAFSTLTAIGVWFRGAGMALGWP
jgi:quinol-cytochrome oxidoreductase complex cytochrome b subunit